MAVLASVLCLGPLLAACVGPFLIPLLLGAVLFFLVAKDLATTPKDFTDLFVYNYERAYPHELDTRPIIFGWSRRPLQTGDLVAAVGTPSHLRARASVHLRFLPID